MIIFTGEKAINFDQVKTINIVKDDDKYAVIAEPGGTIIKFDVKPDAVDFLKSLIEQMSDVFNENVIDISLYKKL
jgi:hypothetical protein